jgi:type VI secretion system protein ImpA
MVAGTTWNEGNSVVNIEELLEPLADEPPCGPNLEYTEAFLTLEKLAKGVPARQDLQTGAETPAELPHWPTVHDQAVALLSRTRDLRVVLRYIEAATHTDGPAGLEVGLRLLQYLLNHCWESVHPRLDVDEGFDPGFRLNILAGLCDPETLLKAVREMNLVNHAEHGRYSLRDTELANGKIIPIRNEAVPSIGAIEAAFLHCTFPALTTTATALTEALTLLTAIQSSVVASLDSDAEIDLAPLQQELTRCRRLVGEWVARRGGVNTQVNAATIQTAVRVVGNDIRSREDIVNTLDRICDYLARTEPANPVPLLLERAKRLMYKNFVEIVQDLAPEMMAHIDKLRGVERGGV